MIKKNGLIIIALILLMSIWGYSLFFIPTFDFDESLYRRIADEMKLTGNFWSPTLDKLPIYHKPPLLYWLMAASSYLFDAGNSVLSSFSARFPSFICSLGIVTSLYFFGEYLTQRKLTREQKWAMPLLFLSAVFPLATATSAIFDPFQTLLLLPTLFIPCKYFIHDFEKNQQLTTPEWITLAFSLFLGTAAKGLNGIIVPTFAIGLHLIFVLIGQPNFRKRAIQFALKFFAFAFVPASALCFLYFLLLDEKIGRAFTREFFLVHHFGRSTEAMETHGGSIFYHPLVAFFGGGFLSAYLLLTASKKKMAYLTEGFAFTYFLAFMIVFGFSATKLPHYTWPIWPALAVLGGILTLRTTPPSNSTSSSRALKFLFSLPVLVGGIVFLVLALNPISLIISQLPSPSAKIILSQFRGFPWPAQILLWLGFATCLLYQMKRDFFISKPVYTAIAGLFTTFVFSVSVMPAAVDLINRPLMELAEIASTRYLKPGDCIRFTNTHSPTISLALGHVYFHNRCEPDQATHLITPEWKLNQCKEHGFEILEQRSYFYLCGRK